MNLTPSPEDLTGLRYALDKMFLLRSFSDVERLLSDPIPPLYLEIDSGILHQLTPGGLNQEQFRFQHVEALLNQAAELLERSVHDRTEWDENRIKAFSLRLAQLEFEESARIHQSEILDGFYRWQAAQSIDEHEAESDANLRYAEALKELQNLKDRMVNERPMRGQVAWRAGFFQGMPWWTLSHEATIARYSALGDTAEGSAGQGVWKWLAETAEAQFMSSADDTQSAVVAQIEAMDALVRSSNKRARAAEEKRNWENHDGLEGGHRFQRMLSAWRLGVLKYRASSVPDGPLNYPEKMTPIKERFTRDFRDALARIVIASEGLREIYGIHDIEPDRPWLPKGVETWLRSQAKGGRNPLPDGIRCLDGCLTWVRSAISLLVRFSQWEQAYVFPFSVRRSLELDSDGAWENALKVLEKDPLSFEISEELFSDRLVDQRHVRLRGITAFAVADDPNSLWAVTVKPPAESYSRHVTDPPFNPTKSKAPHGIMKQEVPACRLGRVQTRESVRSPDIAGISTLHNVSPFSGNAESKWSFSVRPVSSGTTLKQLKDVHLDLHIAMTAFRSDADYRWNPPGTPQT